MKALYDKYVEVKLEADRAVAKAAHRVQDALSKHFRISVYDLTIGLHECKESPIGICVYNIEDDPSRDFCLVCSEPEERK